MATTVALMTLSACAAFGSRADSSSTTGLPFLSSTILDGRSTQKKVSQIQTLPFYLLCDKSSSMTGPKIETLNQVLPQLHHEIGVNPRVSDKARFGIIGFSNTSEVLLPLSDLSDVEEIPKLVASGGTNYTAAFNLLRDTIEEDVKRLKDAGHAVFRPVVFFLSDGMPTDAFDSWINAYSALVASSFQARPQIVAFGIGDCDAATISRVGTFRAFIQEDGSTSPAEALREFASSLSKSIVRSASRDDPVPQQLYVDEKIPGFVSLPLDLV